MENKDRWSGRDKATKQSCPRLEAWAARNWTASLHDLFKLHMPLCQDSLNGDVLLVIHTLRLIAYDNLLSRVVCKLLEVLHLPG